MPPRAIAALKSYKNSHSAQSFLGRLQRTSQKLENELPTTEPKRKTANNLLEGNDNIMLTTPLYLGTRQNAINLKLSTIDLTIMLPYFG